MNAFKCLDFLFFLSNFEFLTAFVFLVCPIQVPFLFNLGNIHSTSFLIESEVN